MAKNKNYNFCAYHSFGNSQSCITAVKWDAYDVKNTAGISGKTIPSGPQISSRFHPGNRAEVLIGQKFQPAYRDRGWKNRGLGNQASPPFRINKTTIFSATQRCNIVATLFPMVTTLLQHCNTVALKIVVANRPM